ncbi:hypothetical protein PF002_g3949 [Phytophthora fragariae]|uniref:Uncharacterized protein n=1 Tax=Phytophthora fragariae TaxID=53985 RepID=A0A6A4A781_9STRA|nr:hypothetical protein PF002_g3949 [Phytophthora fragariae]
MVGHDRSTDHSFHILPSIQQVPQGLNGLLRRGAACVAARRRPQGLDGLLRTAATGRSLSGPVWLHGGAPRIAATVRGVPGATKDSAADFGLMSGVFLE